MLYVPLGINSSTKVLREQILKQSYTCINSVFFSFLRSLNLNKVYQIQNPLCYEPYFYKKKSNFDKTSLLVAPKPTKYRCKASKFEKLVADFRLLSIQNAALLFRQK
jgi:hypothetical protein